MNFKEAFLKFIEYVHSYLNDWENFNGNKWGSFKSSYSSQYDNLKSIVGNEIMFDDLLQHIAQLTSHFFDQVLSKESNFYQNKDYDKLFRLIDFLSSESATFKRNKLTFCELFIFKNFKSKILSPFHNVNLQSSQVNSQNISSQFLQTNSHEKNVQFYKHNNKLRSLYNEKVWLSFSVGLFGKHISRGTTPPALFFDKFPAPYLPKNKSFVEKYNDIVMNTQKQIMELCVSTLSNRLSDIDAELAKIKEEIIRIF